MLRKAGLVLNCGYHLYGINVPRTAEPFQTFCLAVACISLALRRGCSKAMAFMTQISAVVFLKSNYLLKYTVITISATCGVSKGGFENLAGTLYMLRCSARFIDGTRISCTVVVGLLQENVLL